MADVNKKPLSLDEVRQRIKTLQGALRRKLVKSGDGFARGLDCSGENLLQEASAAALCSNRAWPAKVPIEVFVTRAMRSLANSRRARKNGAIEFVNTKNDEKFVATMLSMPAEELDDTSCRLEKVEMSQRHLRDAGEFFKDDPDVTLTMTFRGLGGEQPETMAYTGSTRRITWRRCSGYSAGRHRLWAGNKPCDNVILMAFRINQQHRQVTIGLMLSIDAERQLFRIARVYRQIPRND